jgi:hypothetical protein
MSAQTELHPYQEIALKMVLEQFDEQKTPFQILNLPVGRGKTGN